jgi:CheY-specific phosphatase CheX
MDLNAELYQTAASIFEEVGFIFLMPEMSDEQRDAELEAAVYVEFEGHSRGRLVLAAYGGLLPVLAGNMLGENGPISEDQQRDALGEIANIICGNILPRITGTTDLFHIAAPRSIDAKELASYMAEPNSAAVQLPLEEGRADLLLVMRE